MRLPKQTAAHVAEAIEKELEAMGLPATGIRVSQVVGPLTITDATLRNAAKAGHLTATRSDDARPTWTFTRPDLAHYFAGSGSAVWRTAQTVERQVFERPEVDESKEEWRPLPPEQFPRFEGLYEVSNYGRLRRVGGGQGTKRMVPSIGTQLSNGYWQHSLKAPPTEAEKAEAKANGLTAKSASKTVMVHRLVALAFHERPSDGQDYEVDHVNGNRADNRASNLQWVTRRENMQRAARKGAHRKGLANHATVLTDAQVRETVRLSEEGMTGVAIAKKVGVTPGHVSEILSGKKRADVSGRTPKENG